MISVSFRVMVTVSIGYSNHVVPPLSTFSTDSNTRLPPRVVTLPIKQAVVTLTWRGYDVLVGVRSSLSQPKQHTCMGREERPAS